MGEPQLQLALELELELVGEPITGRIGRSGAPLRRFTGYAALIAELQAIRDETRNADLGSTQAGETVR